VDEPRLDLRRLIPGVYAPCLIYEIGVGALAPVLPLFAGRIGGGPGIGAAIVAILGVGTVVGDIPAGKLAARFGDRRAMIVAATASVGAVSACAAATHWVSLALGVFALGALHAVFLLARQAYLAEHIPPLKRARAMSSLGGVGRIGLLIGPFLGSAVIGTWGIRAVFWVAAGLSALVALVVFAVPDIAGPGAEASEERVSARAIVRDHARLFRTLGATILILGGVRAVRATALPLWGEAIGLSDARVSLIFGLSGLMDALFFYPSGRAMDRHGRMWVAIPSVGTMAVCLLALPVTSTELAYVAVSLAIGLGNSMGAGIVMTLGADLAPARIRAQFLGVWRLLNDAGGAAFPLVVSAGAALGSLGLGIGLVGVSGLLAAGGFAVWLPQFTVHANHTTRRAAGIEAPRDGPG